MKYWLVIVSVSATMQTWTLKTLCNIVVCCSVDNFLSSLCFCTKHDGTILRAAVFRHTHNYFIYYWHRWCSLFLSFFLFFTFFSFFLAFRGFSNKFKFCTNDLLSTSVQFSSRWCLRACEITYALGHRNSQTFLQRCLWNSSRVVLIQNGPLKTDHRALPLSTPPPPHPPQAIGSVKILSFIPVGIVSQASQHCSSSGRKLIVVVAIYLVRHAVYVLGHLIPRASLGLLFICSLFAASSMIPWDGRHVYIVCQIIREMDGMCILSVR